MQAKSVVGSLVRGCKVVKCRDYGYCLMIDGKLIIHGFR